MQISDLVCVYLGFEKSLRNVVPRWRSNLHQMTLDVYQKKKKGTLVIN